MHFVTGDARKFSAAEAGRCLDAVKLTARHADHPVAPKAVFEKAGLSFADKILLFAVVWGAGLKDETLREVLVAGAKAWSLAIEIDFVVHVVERPYAMALAAV